MIFDVKTLNFIAKECGFLERIPDQVGDDTSRSPYLTPQREPLATELTPQSEATSNHSLPIPTDWILRRCTPQDDTSCNLHPYYLQPTTYNLTTNH